MELYLHSSYTFIHAQEQYLSQFNNINTIFIFYNYQITHNPVLLLHE